MNSAEFKAGELTPGNPASDGDRKGPSFEGAQHEEGSQSRKPSFSGDLRSSSSACIYNLVATQINDCWTCARFGESLIETLLELKTELCTSK